MTKSKETIGSTSTELEDRSMSQGVQGFSLLCIAISSGLLAFGDLDNTKFISLTAIWGIIYLACLFPIGSIGELKFGKLSIKKELQEAKSTLNETKRIEKEIKSAVLKLLKLNHMLATDVHAVNSDGIYKDEFINHFDKLVVWANNNEPEKVKTFEDDLLKIWNSNPLPNSNSVDSPR